MSARTTVEDVLGLMPIVSSRGWAVRGGALADSDGRCALCALAHEIDPNFNSLQDFTSAAAVLGISRSVAEAIVMANDQRLAVQSKALEQSLGCKRLGYRIRSFF